MAPLVVEVVEVVAVVVVVMEFDEHRIQVMGWVDRMEPDWVR